MASAKPISVLSPLSTVSGPLFSVCSPPDYLLGLFAFKAKVLYLYSKYVAMAADVKVKEMKAYNPEKSLQRARNQNSLGSEWSIEVSGNTYVWRTKMERVSIIRSGLPYETIEVISKRTNLPVKKVLQLLDVPQTTYNKKKRDGDLLSGRDSELVLVLTELLDFGLNVFNKEKEKFQRWLAKPNISLGGVSPESLLDSLTGIQEVRNTLSRLEYGNLG